MLRTFLALVFFCPPALALAQNEPPPDTRPARERHRIQDKEPPTPEGPWGPEEIGFTWHPPVWRGLVGAIGWYAGTSIRLDVPLALAARSDGVSPPVVESLEYRRGRFRAVSGGVAADLDLLRFSLSWFDGTFDAPATLITEDGSGPPRSIEVDLHGNLYGFRLGAYWPAFRFRDTWLEASLGPVVSVGWLHGETTGIPGTVLRRDTFDVLTGSFGPKASFRILYKRVALELDAEYSFLTGAARGWTREVSAGIGLHF